MQGFCLWYDEKIDSAIDVFKKAKKYKNQKKAAINALKTLNSKDYAPYITKGV